MYVHLETLVTHEETDLKKIFCTIQEDILRLLQEYFAP